MSKQQGDENSYSSPLLTQSDSLRISKVSRDADADAAQLKDSFTRNCGSCPSTSSAISGLHQVHEMWTNANNDLLSVVRLHSTLLCKSS